MYRVAVLDDYARVIPKLADWSPLKGRCEVDFLDRPLPTIDEAARVLAPYHVLCHLRERLAMPRELIERLPNLKMMALTGKAHRTLDHKAAAERGILVCHTEERPDGAHGTPELAIALMLSLARRIPFEERRMRDGHWQSTVGTTLNGKTLGLVGLGRVGRRTAAIASAFGMRLIAWSTNMTAEAAAAAGAQLVTKEQLFRQSDFVSLHLVLGERSRGIVGAAELALMKPTAYLVNTSRGPLIDEAALMTVLKEGRIAGAGIDVYWEEPLSPLHPIRSLDNVVLSPHLGYVVEESMRGYYEDTVANIAAWLDGKPIRVLTG